MPAPVPTPPPPDRVARRALVFCLVTMRAYLENEGAEDTDAYRRQVLDWFLSRALDDELEEDERAMATAELGALTPDQVDRAHWRSEGLGVLGWALGHLELPPHEVESDQQAAARALGFMDEEPLVLRAPTLRPTAELQSLGRTLRTIHWRLREFGLRPGPLDLRALAERRPFGAFDLSGVPLAKGDLRIGKKPIAESTPGSVINCTSIAYERHMAINWLLGDAERYSEVDTAT